MRASVMRMSIFAYHVSQIASAPAPAEFSLHPCEGVNVKVVIRSAGEPELVHDLVKINGESVGNRAGGVHAFTRIVNQAAPQIEYT